MENVVRGLICVVCAKNVSFIQMVCYFFRSVV